MLVRASVGLALFAGSLFALNALPSASQPAPAPPEPGPPSSPASIAPHAIAVSPFATSVITSGEAILQIHDDSLTSFLAGATSNQGI